MPAPHWGAGTISLFQMRIFLILFTFIPALVFSNELSKAHLPICEGGGGVELKSSSYTFIHFLKDFRNNHECEKGQEYFKQANEKYFEKFADVQRDIKKIREDNSCPKLLGLIEKYEMSLEESKKKSTSAFSKLKNAFEQLPENLVQKYHAAWS